MYTIVTFFLLSFCVVGRYTTAVPDGTTSGNWQPQHDMSELVLPSSTNIRLCIASSSYLELLCAKSCPSLHDSDWMHPPW